MKSNTRAQFKQDMACHSHRASSGVVPELVTEVTRTELHLPEATSVLRINSAARGSLSSPPVPPAPLLYYNTTGRLDTACTGRDTNNPLFLC